MRWNEWVVICFIGLVIGGVFWSGWVRQGTRHKKATETLETEKKTLENQLAEMTKLRDECFQGIHHKLDLLLSENPYVHDAIVRKLGLHNKL